MTMCSVKGVAGSDETTEDFHPLVPLSSTEHFSLLFCFLAQTHN